jgi:type II secretory pathway component PulK
MNKVRRPPADRESGVILISILWLVALVSVLVMGALQEWRTELKLAANFQAKAQCHHLAEAGIYYALGKILAKEIAVHNPGESFLRKEKALDYWRTDGSRQVLKLPGSRIEVMITDEAGKLNLNTVSQEILQKLLSAWEYPYDQSKSIIEAILDWRTGAFDFKGQGVFQSFTRPNLIGKNHPFDTVEEILWLPGCAELDPNSLTASLTVQPVKGGINLNAAPPAVLMALGLTAAQTQQLLEARSVQPFRDFQDLNNIVDVSQFSGLQAQVSFQSSVFYTIFSTGMLDNIESRHSIKAIIRLNLAKPDLWTIIYWAEDYPSEP